MWADFERCYRAVQSHDSRFDGRFYTAVTSTSIYCRPGCRVHPPKAANVRFYPTAAAAQAAGFRACKRCRPDMSPGSPEWNVRADLVGRAMRLIADGAVDRDGVSGLAEHLAVSERHLNRQLTEEVGAGPLALARAQRAHTARLLLETTALPVSRVAFAASFSSIRQLNDTVREVFAAAPRDLRRGKVNASADGVPGVIHLRLPYRPPFDATGLLGFLGARAVPGVEAYDGQVFSRALALPHGTGIVELKDGPGHIRCALQIDDLRDLGAAVQRCRRLLDLDADPEAIAEVLSADSLLAPLIQQSPGRRVPGHVDGRELAVRAVLGQQVSVAGARTLAGRLVARYGRPLPSPRGAVTHLFPTADVLAESELEEVGMPAARRRALRGLCAALASGAIQLDPGADRGEVEQRLLALPGIGPWTAAYVAMRALGDPDAFLPTDLGVRRAVERLGQPGDPASILARAERWRPWRAYATQYLWGSLDPPRPSKAALTLAPA